MGLKDCPKKYSVSLLSLFADGELHYASEIESHARECAGCTSFLQEVIRRERHIQIHEKCQENSIILEIFDVLNQRRDSTRLGWEPAWLGFEEERLALLAAAPADRLKFYLKFFWYGQAAIYLENRDFNKEVTLVRGRRYMAIKPGKPQRIIEQDALLLAEQHRPIVEITLKLPRILKENSITRKFSSLSLGNTSFISGFFKEVSDFSELAGWDRVKKGLPLRSLGIYLMHLNTPHSYKKIAQNFEVSAHYVAKLIAGIRKKIILS